MLRCMVRSCGIQILDSMITEATYVYWSVEIVPQECQHADSAGPSYRSIINTPLGHPGDTCSRITDREESAYSTHLAEHLSRNKIVTLSCQPMLDPT